MIAKLLANRHTPIDEIPHLIENVERALSNLDGAPVAHKRPQASVKSAPPIAVAVATPPRARRSVLPREPQEAALPPAASPEPAEIKPVQPTLLRRAEVIHVAPVTPHPQPVAATATAAVRGVVQWFDTRTNRGTLRLQGLSNDLPVDGDALAASGLTRLFKGQEIEATLDGSEETPKITALRLLNLAPNSPAMGGMVRDRHAKQVVVELKREALSRAAARAEAELLLPSRRAR
ncbi:MAG TPA: hypothetical protein VGP48_08260 [Stellaceae bacterium]|nr:hypothetical protein [Stellaceae bacterium]